MLVRLGRACCPIASKPAPTGLRYPQYSCLTRPCRSRLAGDERKALSHSTLLGQGAAFELDDALTVVLDGLGGQHTTLVILQFAIELL